jgi:DNA polymerase-3 subunit epsilon
MAVALPLRSGSTDDPATPLAEVTFAVVDLETTGGSPDALGVTEIGTLKFRGGECLGTFHTLVNPGVPIPPFVGDLTGITDAMVMPAPAIVEVLPSFLEFLHGSVVVGHNVQYDLAFLDAALAAYGYPALAGHRRVDTLALARRLVRDDTTDHRLATLAHELRVPTTPTHRALDDARATAEVLHALLERAAGLGVFGLDDLLELPRIRVHPLATKLRLTARLPRSRGVYLCRDRQGRVVYVGRAANLRGRVRRYFSGAGRRRIPPLLRETEAIEHEVHLHPLAAAVRQLRLVREHEPRLNPQPRAWRRYSYLQVGAARGRAPLSVVRQLRPDGSPALGPLPSTAAARALRNALVAAVPAGDLAATAERAFAADPDVLIETLVWHSEEAIATERFEDAARVRDALPVLRGAVARTHLLARARALGRVTVDGLEFDHGRLVLAPGDARRTDDAVAREEVDELLTVARWLVRRRLLSGASSAEPADASGVGYGSASYR